MLRPFLLISLAGLAVLTLLGCPPAPSAQQTSPDASASASSEPTAADLEEAKTIFGQRCAVCHGATGAGDGAASGGLDPKPRNFNDAAWQAEITDEFVEKIIKYGGVAVGKSAAMPSNPDLNDKPGVVAGLRIHIRSLQSK